MSLNPKYTDLAASTKADAQGTLLDGGFIDIFDGVQPVTADTAIVGQVKLASLPLSNPAFAAAVAGVATANAITSDLTADATGTASWFRAYRSNGTTAVYDGSVGTSGCNLNFSSVAFSAGAAIAITGFTMTEQKG